MSNHGEELRRTRLQLLRQVRQISPSLADQVSKILLMRRSLTNVAIGEVWPWVMGDLVCAPRQKLREIAKAWLAIYVYSLLLDKACDEPQGLTGVENLAGALLFEIGYGDFSKMTSGTPWHQTIRNSIRVSIRDQELELRIAGRPNLLSLKRRACSGKNSGLLMTSAALAACSNVNGRALGQFTKQILLSFQYLDDLTDFESDWRSKNFTPLLVYARKALKGRENTTTDRAGLLEALVDSGALRIILSTCERSIANTLANFEKRTNKNIPTHSKLFFDSLLAAIHGTVREIDRVNALILEGATATEKKGFIHGIDRHLKILAQQS
jgi:hypothetical protein